MIFSPGIQDLKAFNNTLYGILNNSKLITNIQKRIKLDMFPYFNEVKKMYLPCLFSNAFLIYFVALFADFAIWAVVVFRSKQSCECYWAFLIIQHCSTTPLTSEGHISLMLK